MKTTLHKSITMACITGLLFSPSLLSAQAPLYSWAKSMGGTTGDLGNRMTTDASGNTYTVGNFSGTADFDPGAGAANLTSAGLADAFVLKLDASGNFVWAIQLGGTDDDFAQSIGLDASGNIFVNGTFKSTADFDPASGTTNLTSAGGNDIFVCKLDATGNLLWVQGTGTTVDDACTGLTVDASGNVLVTGTIGAGTTVDFDPGAGSDPLTSTGGSDIYIWKLDASGNHVFVKQMGGVVSDLAFSITTDATGNIYTAGSFNATSDFDPSAASFPLTSAGSNDIFVCKLDASGNFVWAKGMGGVMTDIANALVVDASGNAIVTGNFSGTADFDPDGTATFPLVSAGSNEVFICKLDASGSFVWAKSFSGPGFDRGSGLTLDASGNILVAGSFASTIDFDPGAATSNVTSAGSNDAYVCALDATGAFLWVITAGGTGDDGAQSVRVIGTNVYMAGRYTGTADFDPSTATADLVSAGLTDIFVARYQPACTPTSHTITTSACSEYVLNSVSYFISGTYTQTLTNAAGCDSTITLNLTINLPNTGTDVQTACFEYTWIDGNTYTSSTNTPTFTLTNEAGCDSVVTLNLTISTVDTAVSETHPSITALATGATFQWFDCNNAMAPLAGETNNVFNADENGNYAVSITQNGCTDTTQCYTITGIGVNEIEENKIISLYPNPSNGLVTVQSTQAGQMTIVDMNGKTVSTFTLVAGNNQLNVSHLTAGVYAIGFNQTVQKTRWVKKN